MSDIQLKPKEQILKEELEEMITNPDSNKTNAFHFWAFKNAKMLKESDCSARPIIKSIGLSDSLNNDISKVTSVYWDLCKGTFGVTFADFLSECIELGNGNPTPHPEYSQANPSKSIEDYIRAIKAKPFLILGGFSGTGKSQSVKELAYITCPDINGLQSDPRMPGNYCLVSVKPNWHDSSDLLGFYSSINDKYELTRFIRFLVKAMQNPSVPFFACIDEMNLAPVEEYFAEYLSVLESREYNPATKKIESAALLSKDVFTKSYGQFDIFKELGVAEDSKIAESLKKYGLRLPENVVVIGTVNMDDTTHSFSRKVIDRAMTFETQIQEFTADVFDSEGNLHYVSNPMKTNEIMPEFASAKDAITKLKADDVETETLMKAVSEFINEVNTALKGSPFQISYRVLNETLLYYYANRTDNLNEVFNAMLMMKVLPRIEGDQEKAQRPLNALLKWITDDKHDDEAFHNSKAKIMEMRKPFEDGGSGFTTFWN